jgi:hypothetical protein
LPLVEVRQEFETKMSEVPLARITGIHETDAVSGQSTEVEAGPGPPPDAALICSDIG